MGSSPSKRDDDVFDVARMHLETAQIRPESEPSRTRPRLAPRAAVPPRQDPRPPEPDVGALLATMPIPGTLPKSRWSAREELSNPPVPTAPSLIVRYFDLEGSALLDKLESACTDDLYFRRLGDRRFELADLELVGQQTWGSVIIGEVEDVAGRARLTLHLHRTRLPQLVRKQWTLSLLTTGVVALIFSIPYAHAPWTLTGALVGVLLGMLAPSWLRARLMPTLPLGELSSRLIGPLHRHLCLPPETDAPYRRNKLVHDS